MAPAAPASAKITLSYPLYALDFDPRDPETLVVGGGGGAGRSGVGNKITVLNATNATELVETADIDLSKDEDSVTSLAVGPTRGKTTLIYAGVNSGEKDQAEGKNQHFRTFALETAAATKKKTASARISELSRTKLFQGSEAEAYQRVLRLSKPFGNGPQLGIAATGAGLKSKEPEIVLFDTAALPSGPPNVVGRAHLAKEAKDVDVIQTGKDEYTFAYCTEYELFAKTVSSKTKDNAPTCVYVIPGSQDSSKPTVPSFRCVRFMTTEFIIMLSNIHGRNGVAIQILRLPTKIGGRCSLAQSIRLPSNIKMATGLAVCNLGAPKSPGDAQESGQFVIAVASTDITISLYTCMYLRTGSVKMFADLKTYKVLKSVHPLQITGIAFSAFEPPKPGVQPKSLKLASISMGNTVVVHTLDILKHTTADKATQYVASVPNAGFLSMGLIMLIFFTLLVTFITQTTLEIRGLSPVFLGIREGHLQPDVVDVIKAPFFDRFLGPPRPTAVVSSASSQPSSPSPFAASLLALKAQSASNLVPDAAAAAPVVIIRDTEAHAADPNSGTGIKAHLHDEAEDGPHGGRAWEELSVRERERWIAKLKEAGHWAEDLGDTVFKGVLFGAIGGAIGAAVGG